MAARMRNYGAMLDGKLLQCLRELEAGSGEAWARCVQKGGSPGQDLAVARREALSRGLIQSTPKQPPRAAAPKPFPPSSRPVCRWCGGDGIEPGTSVRAAETARLVFHLQKPVTGIRTLPWRGNVSRVRQESATTLAAPLAEILAAAEDRLEEGWIIVEGDLPDRSLACERCNGSGQPAKPKP